MQKFTLIELLVVITILMLLISLVLPSLSNAKRDAQVTSCLNQMRQQHVAVTLYLSANDSRYPDNTYGSGTVLNWMGKSGSRSRYHGPGMTTEERPVNHYINSSLKNGDEIELLQCPVGYASSYDYYEIEGSDYVGNTSSWRFSSEDIGGKQLAEITSPSTVIEILENAGWEVLSQGFSTQVTTHSNSLNELGIVSVAGQVILQPHIEDSSFVGQAYTVDYRGR